MGHEATKPSGQSRRRGRGGTLALNLHLLRAHSLSDAGSLGGAMDREAGVGLPATPGRPGPLMRR